MTTPAIISNIRAEVAFPSDPGKKRTKSVKAVFTDDVASAPIDKERFGILDMVAPVSFTTATKCNFLVGSEEGSLVQHPTEEWLFADGDTFNTSLFAAYPIIELLLDAVEAKEIHIGMI